VVFCVMLLIFELRVFISHNCFSDILFHYVTMCIYDNYYSVFDMMNVNKVCFVSFMCIVVTCTERIVNAAGFTVPIYVCSCTAVQVRRYTVVLF
jgi:hypothetical protein